MKTFLIGSLPHRDLNAALEYSFSFSIPTLVTLPKMDEDEFMVDQALREIDGYIYRGHSLRAGGPVYKSPLRFLSAQAFFARVNGVYKWQACGPLTLAASLEDHPDTQEILEKYFEKIILTQESFNAKSDAAPVFFLDEPMLAFCEKQAVILGAFLKKLRAHKAFSAAIFGLHSCSKVSLEVLSSLSFDLFSIDPGLYPKDELTQIQKTLGERLVFAPAGSKGERLAYRPFKERYASCSCGQALSSQDELGRIHKILSDL